MSDLTTLDPRDLYHKPHLMGETVHRIEKVIEAAAALRRWDDLEKAVDFLIECQQVIVGWWDDHVAERGRPAGNVVGLSTIMSAADAEDRIGSDKSRISRWRTALKNLDTYRERVAQAARRKAELEVTDSHRVNTGEYEWYTPERYIEAARTVMGGIDLDPASHDAAQRTVQADHHFTAADDGLKLDWYGRVWLNPPYAQPLMQNFVRKLVSEHANGNVGQAIMLTHNYTDTAWFHEAQAGALLCFTRGRISFVGASGPPTQGQCFFYFGDRRDEFHAVFRPFGFIR
jgi:phage N-6-adenine-methyltransferase